MKNLLFLLLVSSFSVFASNNKQIDHILSQTDAPFGIVFEVLENDNNALSWAIPQINHYVEKLKKKFPEISIVIVSHGNEQFSLLSANKRKNKDTHQAVKSLFDNGITVSVCGTHASWRGKNASDFPNYVEVVPAGPTSIRNFEDMGFELIVLDK